ncbi:hypothetical protein PIB30_041215 [Stylosanthes scabra]|uniref:BRO1 domain-containing protein n=1 Tax=Stylosanthes scabra TaxID=79078 RepID=A0ABU6QEJ7_9FABA|nr:hypothetical protein [Stylosanthes scabra]
MSNDVPELVNPERVLSIPVKKTDAVGLYLPLRKFVATKYSENDVDKVDSILESLNKCRTDMVERIGNLSLPKKRDCLVHYFKCLCMVEPLFTFISCNAGANADPIIFVWYDAFNTDRFSSQRNNIQLEKAAVLFNLGAIYSQIAASCDRTTALGRHLAMEAFKVAANFFLKLWKVFGKDCSTATLDLSLFFAEFLHLLFSAQASEIELQQQINNNHASYTLQQHQCALKFISDFKLYRRAYEMIRTDSAARKHVCSLDQTWVTHLYQKATFFHAEARQRKSFILPKNEQPQQFSSVQYCALDHDEECVTEILVRGICSAARKKIPNNKLTLYVDLILSEYNIFKIIEDGKLVANPWDMPPPYPTNSAILSSSSSLSHYLAFFPLKKSEPLDLYEPVRNHFVHRYSESVAKRVEGLLEMLDKLRKEMQRDDHSLPIRRDCLIRYFTCLCMIEPFFPINTSSNPPIFVWYDAFNPQEHSSQHNIHLEKASVLFNLGALCARIALSCNLTTIQGHRLSMDALSDASYWFILLSFEIKKACGTIDLSQPFIEMMANQVVHLKYEFPHRSITGSHVSAETGTSDVTEQFLSGYRKAHSLLQGVCQPPCLDLLSEVSPVKINNGNLVANATLEPPNLALQNMSLQETTSSNITVEEN